MCHKSCVSLYTSKTHIQHQVGRVRLKGEPPPLKRLCRSNYLLLTLNCTAYSVEKHVILNLTYATHLGGDLHIFVKQLVVELDYPKIQYLKSARWKDTRANQVEVRLQGAVSDLQAAEVHYHDSCRNVIMTAAGRTSCSSKLNKPILVPPQVED